MPVKYTFINRTSFITHERGHHICPLLFPEPTADACPVDHKKWNKGGCTTRLPTSIGARLRYQLDRESDLYKEIYKQRTATERINAQATALGIERLKLRNGQAIAMSLRMGASCGWKRWKRKNLISSILENITLL
jgi:hypothetical protein